MKLVAPREDGGYSNSQALRAITLTSEELRERALGPWREDLIEALLGAVLIGGLFLDGWNHINLQRGELGGFFTPWHGLLYTGFSLTALWVVTRNQHLIGRGVTQPYFYRLLGIPLRYPFAMAGIVIATAGLVGDIFWHTLFGVEGGVARVIAPFHIALFVGAGLVIGAPIRSAWHAPQYYPRRLPLMNFLPPLVALTMVTALVAFLFQWVSAFMDWPFSLRFTQPIAPAGAGDPLQGTWEIANVARVLATNAILVCPVLLALRRWRLPFGSVTAMFGFVALAMSGLTSFGLVATVAAALAGGLAADVLIALLRPSPDSLIAYRLVGLIVPLVLWPAYFVILAAAYGVTWPVDLALGAISLSAASGVVLSFVAVGPGPSPR